MANSDEIGRIADAVTAIRPEWPVTKVADYLEANHGSRPFGVLAAAAVYVAAYPFASDLSWLEQDGEWWIQPVSQQHQRDPEQQKVTRVRDEAWWANYNLAAARRRMQFPGRPATEPEAGE